MARLTVVLGFLTLCVACGSDDSGDDGSGGSAGNGGKTSGGAAGATSGGSAGHDSGGKHSGGAGGGSSGHGGSETGGSPAAGEGGMAGGGEGGSAGRGEGGGGAESGGSAGAGAGGTAGEGGAASGGRREYGVVACLQLPAVAPCDSSASAYAFDVKTKTCKLVTEGLCTGSGNHFASESECMAACGAVPHCPDGVVPDPTHWRSCDGYQEDASCWVEYDLYPDGTWCTCGSNWVCAL